MQEPHNPYAAPKAPVTEFEQRREVEPVGKGIRFGEFLVDYAGFFLFAVICGGIIGIVWGMRGVAALKSMPDVVVGVIFMLAYYLIFEGIWARSPGKWLFGTAVVGEDGLRPSFGTIALRTLCRFIPFEAFSFFGERGWHDSLSKTYVIKVRGK